MSTPNNVDGVYYSMLEKVGNLGRYQFLIAILLVLVGSVASSCFMINPYLFYEQSFQCPSDIRDCKQYVCSLPISLREPFIPTSDKKMSLGKEFGDLRCEGSQFIASMNTSLLLGSVIGIFSSIFYTQWLGRRGTTIFGLFVAIVGLIMMLIHSETFVIIGLFLYGAGFTNSYTMVPTFITELFPKQNVSQYFNLISISFAIGIASNPIAFYFINNWRLVVIYIIIVPASIAALGFLLFVEDTPIQLIAYDDYHQIYNSFMRIAKWNQVIDHGLTLEGVKEIKQKYDENQQKKHAKVFSIIDLFRYESLRSQLFPMCSLRFIVFFLYYVPALQLGQFDINIYINGLLSALTKLVVIPIQYYLLKMQRKTMGYGLFILTSLLSMGIYFSFATCSDCSDNTNILQTFFTFANKISTTLLSFFVIVSMNETYPSQVRNLISVTTSFVGRAAVLLDPFIIPFCNAIHIPFFILLAIVSVFGFGLTYFTKETYGIPPPEMIEEVKIEQHKYHHYQVERPKE